MDMDYKMETIIDFDFGVGPSNEVVRVSQVPEDVTGAEVNLILWLILEREFGEGNLESLRPDTGSHIKRRTANKGFRTDGITNEATSCSGSSTSGSDEVDSATIQSLPQDNQYIPAKRRAHRVIVAQSQRARKYAEQILRQAGVNLPFEQLNTNERRDLFKQFSASSELLRGKKFGSVLDLFHALRERSRLREEFDILKSLGMGNYGDVFAVLHRKTGSLFAAKRMSLTLDNVEDIKLTLNESSILKRLRHPNIVQCHEAWLEMEHDPHPSALIDGEEPEPLKFYVLMDHCFQNLHNWIAEDHQKPDELIVMKILKQIVDGLYFIHLNRILHLDINTKNIMWADNRKQSIKIGDFGLAIKGDVFSSQTGTFPYYAPEDVFTHKSDMYSVGVTIFEVAEKIQTTSELFERLKNMDIKTRFSLLDEIITSLINKNHAQRPSAAALKQRLENHEINVVGPPPTPMITA